MTTVRLAPDAMLAISHCSGSFTDIDEPVDTPDSSFVIGDGSGSGAESAFFRVSFPSPGGPLRTGAGLQKLRVFARNTYSVGGTHTCSLHVYENGVEKATSGTGSYTVDPLHSGTFEFAWNASILSDLSGAGVECYFAFNPKIDCGALEWVADVSGVALTAAGTAAGAPTFTAPTALISFFHLTATLPSWSPTIGGPTLRQKHILTPVSLAIPFVRIGMPGVKFFLPIGITVASPEIGVPPFHAAHGPWTPLPTQSQQVSEATELLDRILDGLLKTVPGRMVGRPAWDFRRAVGDIRANGKALIVTGQLGPPAIEAWTLASGAGATFDTFDVLRKGIIAEQPFSLPAEAVAHLTTQLTLVQMSNLSAATQYVSREDALFALDRISAAYAPAEEDVADEHDPMTYRRLVALRAASVRDLAERGRQLPRVVPYSFTQSMPTLWLANRIYADGSRSEELIAENKMVHPAFAPSEGICLSR